MKALGSREKLFTNPNKKAGSKKRQLRQHMTWNLKTVNRTALSDQISMTQPLCRLFKREMLSKLEE